MTHLRISLVFILLSFQVNAQLDSVDFKRRYQKDVIYLSVPGYIKNDTRNHKRQLKTEFDFSSEGSKIFKLHQEDASRSILYASMGLLLYYLAAFPSYNNDALSQTLFYSSLIPIGASIHLAIRSNKRMKRSIWLRNRDVLLN